MKQLGNLAIVAANHKECLLKIYDNEVTVLLDKDPQDKAIPAMCGMMHISIKSLHF